MIPSARFCNPAEVITNIIYLIKKTAAQENIKYGSFLFIISYYSDIILSKGCSGFPDFLTSLYTPSMPDRLVLLPAVLRESPRRQATDRGAYHLR